MMFFPPSHPKKMGCKKEENKMSNHFIKISRKPKRNYQELLGNSSDFGSWDTTTDEQAYAGKKKNKNKKKKTKKLLEEIANYEF